MEGVTFTQRVKHSRASPSFPSRSSCLPRCKLACLRLNEGRQKSGKQTSRGRREKTKHRGVHIVVTRRDGNSSVCSGQCSGLLYSLSACFLNFLLRWEVTTIKHQDWLDSKGQEHVHKFHAV